MPRVNYCKKCKLETPIGEKCPYCEKKLTKSGELYSFWQVVNPASDWLSWRGNLCVLLPVFLAFALLIPLFVWIFTGWYEMTNLFRDGYLLLLLMMLCVLLLLNWLRLDIMGTEYIHYRIGNAGVFVWKYLKNPSDFALRLRLLSKTACDELQNGEEERPIQGYLLYSKTTLPWEEVSRLRLNREKKLLYLFRNNERHPELIRAESESWNELEESIRKKLKKQKETAIEIESEDSSQKD